MFGTERPTAPSLASKMMLQATLTAIKLQLNTAEQQLTRSPSAGSLERAALALRKSLEGVALSSLVVNRQLLERGEKAIARMDADDARKVIRSLNPGFWPRPQDVSESDVSGIAVELNGEVEGALQEEGYGRAIGRTSDWLHWRNPLAQPLDVEVGHEHLTVVFASLERLLRSFTMSFPGSRDLVLCSINYGRPGERTIDAPAGVIDLVPES